jgi:hypothetical protein
MIQLYSNDKTKFTISKNSAKHSKHISRIIEKKGSDARIQTSLNARLLGICIIGLIQVLNT